MKCPKCGSTNTKKVSVMSKDWKIGRHICLDCQYMDHWLFFLDSITKAQQEKIHQIGNSIMKEYGFPVEDNISSDKLNDKNN